MSGKLDWTKRMSRIYAEAGTFEERQKIRSDYRARVHQKMQARFDAFVERNQLDCYSCHTTTGPWAHAHRESNGHKWALCKRCARKNDKRQSERPGATGASSR